MLAGGASFLDEHAYFANTSFRDELCFYVLLAPFWCRVDDEPATAIYDCCGTPDRAFVLYATAGGAWLAEVERDGTRPGRPTRLVARQRVDDRVRRIASTSASCFLASAAEVRARDGAAPIAMDPVDVATTQSELAVLDAKGLGFYDETGTFRSRMPLEAASALAYDVVRRCWVYADAGDLFELVGDRPQRIASDVGLVTRIRREYRGPLVYSTADGALWEIVDGVRSQIASYPPGFTNFAAGVALLVVEDMPAPPGRPVPFYRNTRCGCRTRTVQRESAGTTVQADQTMTTHERITCPRCHDTWIEDYY